ncbi:insecticidal delta-endotoxin Cry8Ea1 family protein [Bacillus cereus]|uniref:insecticidal delta-endotoxin Cry8Ea1 family protein n=1 Tax=Bacillus cereus TaxID=1396 RepID=UPI00398078BA
MKYKDRKDAKRKSKKALLVTVATMTLGVSTLGVSTLGSTASAFAEEKDQNVAQQQNIGQQKSAGTFYTAPTQITNMATAFEKTLELLKNQKFTNAEGKQVSIFEGNKYITPEFLKGSISTTGVVLKQIYSDAYSKDFNNASRELAVSLTALIPYGGSIASPLLALIWPENVGNSQMKKIEKLIDAKIIKYDITTLKIEYNNLMTRQIAYEKSMTEPNIDKNTRKTNAINAQNAFTDMIAESNKSKELELAELPVYTTVAAAHIAFLKSMQVQQTRSAAGIDQGTINSNFNSGNLTDQIAIYTKHIQDVYDKREKEIFKQIEDIGKPFGGSISINNYQTVLTNKYNAIAANRSGNDGIEHLKDSLVKAKRQCEELSTELKALYDQTLGNAAFITMLGQWKKDTKTNKWSYIDTKGETKTDWLRLGDKWYYLSKGTNGDTKNLEGATFAKGEMVTGTMNLSGKTYYFNSDGEMIDYNSSSMNRTYKVVAKLDSSKVLDNDFNHDRLSLLWNDNGGDNQKWFLQYNTDKKAYKIINQQAPHDELAVNGQDNTVFATDDRNDSSDLRYWTLEPAGNGYVFIKNKASGRVLDVADGNTADGTVIKTHSQNTTAVAAQMFKLETVQQ